MTDTHTTSGVILAPWHVDARAGLCEGDGGEKPATSLWNPAGIAAMSIRAFIIFIFGSSLNVSDLMLGEVPSAGSLGQCFPNTARASCTLLHFTHFTPLHCSSEKVPCWLPSKITCSGEVGEYLWELVSPEGINPVLDWVVP